MANQVHVSSEIGKLRRVIVHRPDEGIARISPKRAEELLFDDIVYLPKMQEEHDIFTNVLRAFLGSENVLGATNLLRPGPLELLWWQWIAMAGLLAVAWLGARVLGGLAQWVLRAITRRTPTPWDDRLVDGLTRPLRLLGVRAASLVRVG